jgi:hypothetical protein
MDNDIRRDINWLDREDVVNILEQYGFACYDHESTDSLRNELFNNILDRTIPETEVQ